MDDRTGLNQPSATAEQDPDARAREIRAEIERAREDMSETVERDPGEAAAGISPRPRPRAPPTK